jgi:hypothetical protein
LGCFKSLNFKQNKSSKNIYIHMADNNAELQSACMFTGQKTIQFKQKFLKTVQKELTKDLLSEFFGFSSGVVFLSFAPSFSSTPPFPPPMPWWLFHSAHQQQSGEPLPSTPNLTSLHLIPAPALLRAHIIAQKGGFVAGLLTVRQAISMPHSKWYGRLLG